MYRYFCILLIVLLQKASSHYYAPQKSCGYESCHPIKDGAVNIHIVCHTHLDTGWVFTYEEYYRKFVMEIYKSVYDELRKSPDRKFIAVETSFFSRWYNDQDYDTQREVRRLVETGQLEFISGGWSMNDEACPQYLGIINQMTLGHKWLNKTFGECGIPKVGWQIDPFGHSREFASILSQMGFDGQFLGRIDYQDKETRERQRTMEFIWKSSPSLGKRADLFTGILPNIYWPPKGFCFDFNCFDEQITPHNAQYRAREFIRSVIRPQLTSYATNNTVITMGMDFYYRDADKWYRNLDALFKEINKMDGYNIFYSTPSCYLKSLYDAQIQWPVKADDFFPYADARNTYWSGYFTSRPTLKHYLRYAENLMQIAKQLNVLSLLGWEQAQKIQLLDEVLGIMHHHDAITGTAKQYVVEDYAHMIHQGIKSAEQSIVDSMNRVLFPRGPLMAQPMHFCHLLNTSHCDIVQRMATYSSIIVHVYNPIANPVKTYIRLPVYGGRFMVLTADGSKLESQVHQVSEGVMSLPSRIHNTSYELLFRASLPALGYTSFLIHKTQGPDMPLVSSRDHSANEFRIDNGKVGVIFDSKSGLIKEVVLEDGRRVPFAQNFHIYRGETASFMEKPSGAYAFNPTPAGSVPAAAKVQYKIVKGSLVEEVHQVFNSWISQVVRVYQHTNYIEFDWFIGPIPKDRWYIDLGREVITRYETQFRSNATFWTDSNARETMRRTRNHRLTWNLMTEEEVASNYYPVSGWIFIRDYEKNLQLTVLPDRPEGGSSLVDGHVELMLHRRLFTDDGFGMDEALDEPGVDNRGLVVRGTHRVVISDIRTSVQSMRTLSKAFTMQPLSIFRPKTESPYDRFSPNERIEFIGLNRKLPLNIHLLSLERWDENRLLIRLEHFFEVNEDPKYSRPRRVSLRDLFSPLKIVSAQEVTLNGLQDKRMSEQKRLRFVSRFDPYFNYTNLLSQIDPSDTFPSSSGDHRQPEPIIVILFPMDIKTFLVTFEAKTFCVNSMTSPRAKNRVQSVNC